MDATPRITATATAVRPATRMAPLAALGLAVLVLRYRELARQPTSWHFFADAATGLVHGAGVRLYLLHPEFQFGPIAALAAGIIDWLPHALVRPVASTVLSIAGVAVLVVVERIALVVRPGTDPIRLRMALWLAAIPALYAWSDIAVRSQHIDDAMALLGISLAALGLVRRRPWTATAWMALAVAAKPWALVCAPMVAAGDGRGRWLRPVVAGAAAGATWLPFLVGAPRTLHALARFTIPNSATSGLRVLGVVVSRTPTWDRPAQIIGGLAVAALLVRLDRWWAVPLSALSIRLLLDPGTHRYYGAGVVLAVLLWELIVGQGRVPWRTALAAFLLERTASASAFGPDLGGHLRFAFLSYLILLPFWERWRAGATSVRGTTASAPRRAAAAGAGP
jgi:hypothetical protein